MFDKLFLKMIKLRNYSVYFLSIEYFSQLQKESSINHFIDTLKILRVTLVFNYISSR